jgi:hypothetical protein
MVYLQTKNLVLVHFVGRWNGNRWPNYGQLPHFSAIWYILWPFGIFVVIWYIFNHFGILYQEESGNPGCKQQQQHLRLYCSVKTSATKRRESSH